VGPGVQPLPNSQQGLGAENPIPIGKTSVLSAAIPAWILPFLHFACKYFNTHKQSERDLLPVARAVPGTHHGWALL